MKTKTYLLAEEHFNTGAGMMSETTAYKNHKIWASCYRQYVKYYRGFVKAAEAAKTTAFVAENKGLVEILKAETESLRVQYIAKVTTWANGDFDRIEKFVLANGYLNGGTYYFAHSVQRKEGESYKDHSKRLASAMQAGKLFVAGREAFVSREVKLAEQHYQDSIVKLAARIEAKGMNKDALTVKTAHVGVNIETVLTDGKKTVRAWTIIASGEVQRPHYRYLVK